MYPGAEKDSRLPGIDCPQRQRWQYRVLPPVILRDISTIREAEEERRILLEELHQTKKMNTMGRLAGGVAHDFNNLMTVIMGYAELGMMNNAKDKPNEQELKMILDSAQKAARLSSQLLDFSSKQMIEPQVLNLNEVIRESLQFMGILAWRGNYS